MYYGAYKCSTNPDGQFIESHGYAVHENYYYQYPSNWGNAKACSLKGKEQGGNGFNRSIYNTMIKNKGTKYNIESYLKHCYILGLLMLVCKGRDIENAIGKTYYEINPHYPNGVYTTGTGIYYSAASFNSKSDCLFRALVYDNGMNVTCFGINMFHGHNSSYIDGISGNYSSSKLVINNIECELPFTISKFQQFSKYVTDMIVFCNGAVIFPLEAQADNTKGWKSALRTYSAGGSDAIPFITTLDSGYFGFTLSVGGVMQNTVHGSVRFTAS